MPDNSIHDPCETCKVSPPEGSASPLAILPRRFHWYLRSPARVTTKLGRLRSDREYWQLCANDPRGSERGKAVARGRLARCERKIAALTALRAWMHATKRS